jgi:tRNA-splicing ligase RtcB
VEHGHELGTIGRGNHFVELRRATHDGSVWLLVHTGSRSLGPSLQARHRGTATDRRGGYARVLARSDAGVRYLEDVDRAVAWARENRRVVIERALEAIGDRVALRIDEATRIDTHHDSVRRERHVIDGEPRDVFVHRKGAMALGPGERGLVPGSMGADVAIVRSRDDAPAGALGSCPHGAGRVMTRTEARRVHEVRDLARSMHGVVFDARLARGLLDEIPSAYKDLDAVLADARSLIRVEERLTPLLVHKGIG